MGPALLGRGDLSLPSVGCGRTISGMRRSSVLGWAAAWVALGAGYAFAAVSILSVGIFVLPIVVALTVVVARRPGADVGATALVSGLGLPLLLVAWLNRDGPGTVCTRTATGASCEDQSSPWPWLLAAVALGVAGVALTARRARALDAG